MKHANTGKKTIAVILSILLMIPMLFTESYAAENNKNKSIWTFKKALAQGWELPEKIYPGNYKKDSGNEPLHTVEPGDDEYPDIMLAEEFQTISSGSSENVLVPDNWNYAWYSFTAENAGTYIFSSDLHEFTRTTPDPLVVVFDEAKEELTQSDDTELDTNFQVIIGLDKGETCYFAVTARNASGGKLEIPVTLNEKPDFEIESLTVEDYKLYAMDSYEEEDGTVYYDFQPSSPDLNVFLELKDGRAYSGNIYDVLEELYIDYGFVPGYYSDLPQSKEEPLNSGMNKDRGIIYIDDFSNPYYFNVIVKIADVTRIAGNARWTTSTHIADKMKEVLGADRFDAVVIAYGNNYADALAGSYLAAMKNAPILLTSEKRHASVAEYVQKNMDPEGTAYILGGTAVISDNMIEELNKKGINNVVRLGGDTRYETCRKILNEAQIQKGQEVLVCTGSGFADSLSASTTGLPILLISEKNVTNAKTIDFLNQLKAKKVSFTIIGGESAVSDNVKTELEKYGKVSRVAGGNRYTTSTAIAEDFFYDPTNVILAYASNFPDGLCAGPLGYLLEAPLLLTTNNKAPIAQEYIQTYSRLHEGYVTGGSGLISDDAVETIFGAKPEFIIAD